MTDYATPRQASTSSARGSEARSTPVNFPRHQSPHLDPRVRVPPPLMRGLTQERCYASEAGGDNRIENEFLLCYDGACRVVLCGFIPGLTCAR